MSNKALSRFHQKISVPGRRLVHHIPLAFVRKKVSGAASPAVSRYIPDAGSDDEAAIDDAVTEWDRSNAS